MNSKPGTAFILFYLLTLFLFCSCQEVEVKLNKSDIEFARTLANVQMARSATDLIEDGDKDSARIILISKALAMTGMDTLSFYAQLQKYGQDPPKLKVIYDSSIAIIDRQKNLKIK